MNRLKFCWKKTRSSIQTNEKNDNSIDWRVKRSISRIIIDLKLMITILRIVKFVSIDKSIAFSFVICKNSKIWYAIASKFDDINNDDVILNKSKLKLITAINYLTTTYKKLNTKSQIKRKFIKKKNCWFD